MNRRALLASLFAVIALGAASIFIPAIPSQVIWLVPAASVGLAASYGGGAGLIGAFVSSLALASGGQRVFPAAPAGFVGATAASIWLLVIATASWRRQLVLRHRAASRSQEVRREQDRAIQKDIDFYTERARALSERAQVRRQLSTAARELGGLLNPGDIQNRLVDLAKGMFEGAEVTLSAGASRSPVAIRAFERNQAVAVPAERGGRSEMAVPLRAARSTVGVLHVASGAQSFGADHLRLLEVLSSLASEALDNGLLFEQVQQNALRDGLTGLVNHRALHERLEAALLEASRYRQPVSVILADVDHFKNVNDTHGHPAGDAVLQGFAHVLDRNARDVDVVARYGGEEFVILLFQMGYDEAMAVAERVRLDIAEQAFDANGKALYATASLGVATFPEDATSAQQLMRQADQRLYAAKKGGRNRVVGRNG